MRVLVREHCKIERTCFALNHLIVSIAQVTKRENLGRTRLLTGGPAAVATTMRGGGTLKWRTRTVCCRRCMDGRLGCDHHELMSAPVVVRPGSSLFRDRRDDDRALRVTWHPVDDLFVLSTWHGGVCVSTVQLGRSDVPAVIAALAAGLADTSTTWSVPSYRTTSQAALPGLAQRVRRTIRLPIRRDRG